MKNKKQLFIQIAIAILLIITIAGCTGSITPG